MYQETHGMELLNEVTKLLERNKQVLEVFSPISPDSPFWFDQEYSKSEYVNKEEIGELISTINIYCFSRINNKYDESIETLHLKLNQFFSELLNDNYPFKKSKLLYLKILMIIYICRSSFEEVYSDEIMETVKNLSKNTKYLYYRGHASTSYTLIPSMYRNLEYTGIIDFDYVKTLYSQTAIFDKYKKTIDEYGDVDYKFCSFAQHAVAYSPLLDFTKEVDIAKIFATLPNVNPNQYKNDDCALYILGLNTKVTPSINISDVNIQYSNRKLNYRSLIYGTPLYKCSLKDFDVELAFSDYSTNDRMKYQKGVFLFFKRVVIANKIILLNASKGYFIKLIIKCENSAPKSSFNKINLYKAVVKKFPQYKYEYMLNPYSYFEETNLD